MRQRTRVGAVESPWGIGWFVGAAEPRSMHMNGSNPGLQTALYVYPDQQFSAAVIANSWGVGANSGDMVMGLPGRMAALCGGWK